MVDRREPPSHPPSARRRRDQWPGPLYEDYELVDEDFDDIPLEDLQRQAGTGRIDVADL